MSATGLSIVRRLGVAAAALGMLAGCGGERDAAAARDVVPPQKFDTPEAAAAALVAAAASFDTTALRAILGSEGATLVTSRDHVSDRNDAAAFAEQAKQQRLEFDSTRTQAVLTVGPTGWPLPMPIVQRDGKWAFDAAAGEKEVLARRIGRNELAAITACRGYVDAQHAYALVKHDGSIVNQYAQRVISTPGKQDGLGWRAADGSWQGPISEGVARLIAEGYKEPMEPFHGYYFKILKGQGPSAELGTMDFMVDGAMIGGFALVAAPAEYLVTGVKTFIVSHEGVVYEKDFGERTLEVFKSIERYDPDSTWTRVPGT